MKPQGTNTPLNPERQERLSVENAKRRIENRDLRAENDRLQKELAELRGGAASQPAGKGSTGAPAGNSPDAGEKKGLESSPGETDSDEEPVDEEGELLAELRESDEVIRKYVEGELFRAGALHPQLVFSFLADRGILKIAPDGRPDLFVDEKLQPLTLAALSRVLPPDLIRAQGKPGMGGRGTGAVDSTGAALDMEKARQDFAYYQKNRNAIQAKLKGE